MDLSEDTLGEASRGGSMSYVPLMPSTEVIVYNIEIPFHLADALYDR